MTGSVLSQGAVTSEDSKAFTNIFDIDLQSIDDAPEELSSYDGAIVVGGGGAVPHFSNNPPVIGVIRHRPAAEDDILVISKSEDGSTSTTVTHLLREADVVPDQRVATALLYGVRAGTREFRRVSSQRDYESASYLHDAADHSQIEALRSPGMSDETFDVMGAAIANRERRASFAVTNVGSVPAVSSLEEAADTLLRLDGVSSAAVFGIHDGTIVTSCRAEDVRVNALDILEKAFDDSETIGGNADAAMARVPLGLFARIDDHHQTTLDDLIDASTRKALFSAFESS
ncbi:bifunctional oligoribonuclease/PAP phosphatase NrnA [Halobacteriaceae archaeon GCM10025711]